VTGLVVKAAHQFTGLGERLRHLSHDATRSRTITRNASDARSMTTSHGCPS
jgi:hypothetical protein